jgi:hypothetical protein
MTSPAPSDAEQTLELLLRAAADEPVRVRCAAYRTAAEWCGRPEEASRLKKLAAELEAADRRCQEFAFAFTQQTRAASAGSTQS